MPERPAPARSTFRRKPSRRARPERREREPRMEAPQVDQVAAAALDAALTAAAATAPPELRSFGKLGLPDVALRALDRGGLHRPFAIQTSVLPDAMEGRDILARAATGSGKTLAFGLPTLMRLYTNHKPFGTTAKGRIRAVALVPTRELARQVADALKPIAEPMGLTMGLVYGGAPIHKQIERMNRGVDFLIATPGRLIDLMERGVVVMDDVEVTVLDEADYLADLGFLPALTTILDATPRTAQRMLFSATLDRQVALLVERYLTEPSVHAIAQADDSASALMTHQTFVVTAHEKMAIAAEIAARPARTLFFTKTKAGADVLAEAISRQGVNAAAIHSDLNQRKRMNVLDAFTAGTTRVLVATDVAARGLHIPDVDLIVHFDPPHDHKDYLHRSGRTARAGATGTVVSFVTHTQVRRTARLHEDAAVKVEKFSVAPGHDAVRALATSGAPIPPPAPTKPDRKPRSERTHAKHGAGPRPEHGHVERPRRDDRPRRTEDSRPPRRTEDVRPARAAEVPRSAPHTSAKRSEDRRPERRPESSRPPRHDAQKNDRRPERTEASKRPPRAESPTRVDNDGAPKKARWTSADKAARRTPAPKTTKRSVPAQANQHPSAGNRAARRAHLQSR